MDELAANVVETRMMGCTVQLEFISAQAAQDFLDQLEDIQDIHDAEKAKAEGGELIPWEEVKKNLNLA